MAMEQTLAKFVHALRNADVVVTPAETLDAMDVLRQVGVQHRQVLKDALSMTLAKTVTDKRRFEACFEQFFAQFAFADAPKQTLLRSFEHSTLLAQFEQGHVKELVRAVLANERTTLAYQVQQIGDRVGVVHMRSLRDKPRVAEEIGRQLGLPHIVAARDALSGELATGADYVRRYVTTQIKQYVDLQYDLAADASGRRAVLQAALEGNLAQISKEYQAEIDRAVAAFAEQLRTRYRKKQRRKRRGALDVRHMIRRNVAYDGSFFELAWRGRHRQDATVYVLCDVSGSVARLSRFLLILLHKLADILPDVRLFAFSNRLGEVTDHFKQHDAAMAAEEVLFEWGNGNTDYGQAWLDFRALAGTQLNHRATVIVLGDARSNFYEAHMGVLKELANRAGKLIWLNPEPRKYWGEGDSEMLGFAPFCLHVDRLATLKDLKRVTERLVNLLN
jgi:uncharacterized protein with von Willebrand factor type A (vWA) domain